MFSFKKKINIKNQIVSKIKQVKKAMAFSIEYILVAIRKEPMQSPTIRKMDVDERSLMARIDLIKKQLRLMQRQQLL